MEDNVVTNTPPVIEQTSETPYSTEKPFYQRQFAKFDKNGGFVATWNWPAMGFGLFWYCYRGMWWKALAYLGLFFVASVLAVMVGLPLAPLAWIYFGIMGNYDYYLLKAKGLKLWS